MPVIEKYQVNRSELLFNGKRYNKGDAISHQEIVSVAPEKLGTLVRTRTIIEPPNRTLDDMTKDELIDYGHEIGANFQSSWKKADIAEAIEEAKHGS